MDPRLQELIEKGVAALNSAELAEMLALISAAGAAVDPGNTSPEIIAELNRLAEVAGEVRVEITSRDEAVSAAQSAILDAVGDPAAADADAEVAEPVAASAKPHPVALSAVRQTDQPHREPPQAGGSGDRIRGTLTASGMPLPELDAPSMAEMFNSALANTMNFRAVGTDPGVGRHIVIRSRYKLPSALSEGNRHNPEANTAALTAAAAEQTYRGTGALTASGGICRPVSVDYNIPTWSNVARPIKDALPAVEAPRGGLQFAVPPVFSMSVYGAGVGIWSEANDENPGGSNTGPLGNPTATGPVVKPSLDIDCGSFMEVDVEAITSSVTISNFRGRFSPEQVTTTMVYLEQAFAATAEIELLRQMRSYAKHVTTAQQFGLARDALVAIDRICAYFRDKYRMSDNVILRVVLKAWVRNAIRADLAKAAFAGLGDASSLAVSDAQIDEWFAVRNVVPIWTLDDDQGDQSFASQTAGTEGTPVSLVGYPAVTRMLVYPEGTYQRLDGGELNLGVVRDSALNAVNKYQVFSETFEAIAFRGFEAIDFRSAFVVNGGSAGTLSPA